MARARQIVLPAWVLLGLFLLGGCNYDRNDAIPAEAMMRVTGDKQLQYTANEPGMVYVYDRNNDRLLYSGQMDRGETINVDPDHNLIAIGGRTVMQKGVNNGDTRRIFFKPMQPTDERVIIEQHHDSR